MTEQNEPAITPDPALAICFSGPAVRANRFYFTPDNVCRLSFLEQATPDAVPAFRAAVALSIPDVAALAQLLNGWLVQFAASQAPVEAAAEPEAEKAA